MKNNNDLTACILEHLLTRSGYLSISGQTIITVKHLIRVNFDGSCYISLVFPLKIKNVKQNVFTFFRCHCQNPYHTFFIKPVILFEMEILTSQKQKPVSLRWNATFILLNY